MSEPQEVHMRMIILLLTTAVDTLASSVMAQSNLPRSTPEQQGVLSSDVLTFIEDVDSNVDTMNSFMLVRHGHVVAETWWAPYDAETPHVLYSLSKSLTSTAVGLAIHEGKLNINDEVLKFFPDDVPAEPSANLKAMRVRDLLRMTTGHQTEPPTWRDDPDSPLKGATWTKKFYSHPVNFKPGTLFVYNTSATYMQSAIVQKVSGMTVRDYLVPRLFEPLGIATPIWFASPEGVSAGGFGLNLRTEDLAKFGQLYLQNGEWNGRQLIPAVWIKQATTRQTSNGSDPNSDWSQGYCFQFWRSRHNSYRGDGAFGQYLLVLPEQDAVIIITSGVKNMQDVMNRVWDKLLPAMKPEALPNNADAAANLQSKLKSLTLKKPSGNSTSPLASEISGKWFEFPENDRGIKAVSLDLTADSPTFTVRTAAGEIKTQLGFGSWQKTRSGFASGMDRFISVPENTLIAASGAWDEKNVLTIKLVACETPFYATLTLKYEGDRLLFDTKHNVAFGPTDLPQLLGKRVAE